MVRLARWCEINRLSWHVRVFACPTEDGITLRRLIELYKSAGMKVIDQGLIAATLVTSDNRMWN